MTTGRPSRTASSAPGAHGFAMHQGLSGNGTGDAGGGLPVARIAMSASRVAPSASTRRSGRPAGPGRMASTSEVTG